MALEVMIDIGIDMSHASSKLPNDIPKKHDILVTMGCGVECPFVPTKYRDDWGLDDPIEAQKKLIVNSSIKMHYINLDKY